MFRTNKSIRKIIALFLVLLLALTVCIGSVMATGDSDTQTPARPVEPVGSMSVKIVKTFNSGNAKKYTVYLELGSNVDISEFTLNTISISGVTLGGTPFSISKDNIVKYISSPSDYTFVIGYITLTSNITSASATSSVGQMKKAGSNSWFTIPAFNNSSVTIQN